MPSMTLDGTALTPWLQAFLEADLLANSRGEPSARAPFCTQAVTEGFAGLEPPEAPLIARVHFKTLRRAHPSEGSWAEVIVSEATGARRGAGKYHLMLVVQAQEGTPTITGVYDVCTACVTLGLDAHEATCIECSGLGWEHWFGVDLGGEWGEVIACERAQRPSTPLYLPAWKRDSR